MYLNVLNLFDLLDALNPLDSHYLGQRSIDRRIDVREMEQLCYVSVHCRLEKISRERIT